MRACPPSLVALCTVLPMGYGYIILIRRDMAYYSKEKCDFVFLPPCAHADIQTDSQARETLNCCCSLSDTLAQIAATSYLFTFC